MRKEVLTDMIRELTQMRMEGMTYKQVGAFLRDCMLILDKEGFYFEGQEASYLQAFQLTAHYLYFDDIFAE